MFLDSGVIVLVCRTGGGGRAGRNKGLFDTWRFVKKGSLWFRKIVGCRKEISNVHLIVIRTNTTKEGDTVLRTQFLNQASSVHKCSHGFV